MQESTDFDFGALLRNEKFIETAILILFISVFVFLKFAQPWGYEVSHTFPPSYVANDNFGNGYVYPQYIKEVGNLRYEPWYIAGYKNILGNYPPVLFHLSAMLSILSGVETYDATGIVIALFSVVPLILVYSIIRRYSKELAIISLPFMLGLFSFDFEIARVFGLWIYVTGALFLTAVIWLAERMNAKYAPALLAIFLAGAALGHMSEAIFSAGFLAFYVFLRYMKEHAVDKTLIKNIALGFAGFLVLSAYYLVIFKYTWVVNQPFKFEVMGAAPFAPNFGVKLSDFGIVVILAVAGILLGLKRMAFRKKDEFPFTAVAAGLFILVIGLGNYFGLGVRAWQTRHAWPVYLAVFSGIALYYLLNKTFKNWDFRHYASVGLALILLFSYVNEGKLSSGGIVDQNIWDSFKWVRSNTPENAKVAHFMSPYQDQVFSIWSTGRMAYVVSQDDYIDKAQKGIVGNAYNVSLFNPMVAPYESVAKISALYGKPPLEAVFDINKTRYTTDDMDYYVFLVNGPEQYAGVVQYNRAIIEKFIKDGAIEAYTNGEISILKRKSS